jgi:cytochrome c oxidase cbb3-type subunit 1
MTAVAENPTERIAEPPVPVSAPVIEAMERPAERFAIERAMIDRSTSGPVLTFFATAISWLFGATVFGVIATLKLYYPHFLADHAWLTYGRIVPAYQAAFTYGWCSLAGMGVAIWIMARLCRVPIKAPGMLVFGAITWNIGLTIGVWQILVGQSTGIEGLEMPHGAMWVMFGGFLSIGLWGAALYRARKEAIAFISVWYLLGAFFWFPWIFAISNLLTSLPEIRGVMPAVIGSWYLQSLNIWWFTAIGLAAAYYLIPKVIGRPVHSYNLASVGFWSFAVLGGLTGMVRLNGGPVPAWLVTLSIAATIMMIVPIATVTANLVMTMSGKYYMVHLSPTVRFTFFGVIAFAIGSVLSVISALRSVDQYVHFTPWVQGQQELLLYGFFSMVIFGAIYYITPRLVGCEWLSSTLIKLHFWGAAYGGGMFIFMLLLTGISMGGALRNPEGLFTQVIGSGLEFISGRMIAFFLVTIGHGLFALHFLLMLLRIGQPGGEPTLFPTHDEH